MLDRTDYRNPPATGNTHMIATGHPLATAAGYRILQQGGNATDAGVAAGLALNVAIPQFTSFGGVAPIMVHDSARGETMTISGVGRWPRAASIEYFDQHTGGDLPPGVLRTVTPAAADAWLTALRCYGTMTFQQVVAPALELAEGGIPMSDRLYGSVAEVVVRRFPLLALLHRMFHRMDRWGLRLPQKVKLAACRATTRRLPLPGSGRRLLKRVCRANIPGVRNILAPLGQQLDQDEQEGRSWDSTRQTFLPQGAPLRPGELLAQKDLANTFRRLAAVEQKNAASGREAALQAVRDYFYRGPMAEEIVRSCRERGGLLTRQDMAEFQVTLQPPEVGSYKGIEVCACGTWSQGPAIIQTLNLLEGFDLQEMGHNRPQYLHTLIEALKLAFADREMFYGDPEFVQVPLTGMLSKDYADQRRQRIDGQRAWPELPPAGQPWRYQEGGPVGWPTTPPEPVAGAAEPDTSYIAVVDRWGNGFSATPSDGISTGPLANGLGFVVSHRGSQSWLDPSHPASVAPGKRPRLTPNPLMAFRDGQLWMPFGTPGGEAQCQALVQVFLNMVEFGMNPQQAIEAPRVASWSFPNSFWPHAYYPGLASVEGRIPPEVVAELAARGHEVRVWGDWDSRLGSPCAIQRDRATGSLRGGADPRLDASALGE